MCLPRQGNTSSLEVAGDCRNGYGAAFKNTLINRNFDKTCIERTKHSLIWIFWDLIEKILKFHANLRKTNLEFKKVFLLNSTRCFSLLENLYVFAQFSNFPTAFSYKTSSFPPSNHTEMHFSLLIFAALLLSVASTKFPRKTPKPKVNIRAVRVKNLPLHSERNLITLTGRVWNMGLFISGESVYVMKRPVFQTPLIGVRVREMQRRIHIVIRFFPILTGFLP